MLRSLQPELLDSLPFDHPDARGNRRDLRMLNRLMGNYRWFARTLPPLVRPGERVLELGAGIGELGLLLAKRRIAVDGIDLWPRPSTWPAERAWHQTDICSFDGYGEYPVVIANLILHQFSDAALANLGRTLARRARLIVACEPERSERSRALVAAAAPFLRLNHVTRHDARVSIEAGFRGDELPMVLGLASAGWQIECKPMALGAYRMVAIKRP
jgi:2-polyprenyl-3-methyl-5-hydroxy-6-metoxy-1,4-benzoquinol methylase